MTAPANVNTVLWTIALIADVAFNATIAGRWLWLGPARATTRALRGGLLVATLTLLWVYPGIVALVGVLIIASLRRILPRHRGRTGMS